MTDFDREVMTELAIYDMDAIQTAETLIRDTDILVLSGFSGTGKGDVCDALIQKTVKGKPVCLIRSVTNREPRFPGENYTFVSKDSFASLVSKGMLLEFNDNYASHCYGTPVCEVLHAIIEGKLPLLEIDYSGMNRLKTEGKVNANKVRSVFLVPPSAEELVKRLQGRGTESETSIHARLTRALFEADQLNLYDAVVVNDNVQAAAERVAAAFEGKVNATSFNSAVFKNELKEIIAWKYPSGYESCIQAHM